MVSDGHKCQNLGGWLTKLCIFIVEPWSVVNLGMVGPWQLQGLQELLLFGACHFVLPAPKVEW
jgi:hypothetical protein